MNVIKGFYKELFQKHGSSLFDIPSVQDSAPEWRQVLRHSQVEEAILNSLEAYKVKVRGGAPVCVTTAAFCTPFGLFELNRMPFGLCNAPSTFQCLMERLFGDQ